MAAFALCARLVGNSRGSSDGMRTDKQCRIRCLGSNMAVFFIHWLQIAGVLGETSRSTDTPDGHTIPFFRTWCMRLIGQYLSVCVCVCVHVSHAPRLSPPPTHFWTLLSRQQMDLPCTDLSQHRGHLSSLWFLVTGDAGKAKYRKDYGLDSHLYMADSRERGRTGGRE